MSSAQTVAIQLHLLIVSGLATSTFFILTDIGLGIGPFLQGFFVPAIGYNGLYIVLGILLVICLPLHYLLNKRKSTAPTVITNS